MTPVQPTTANQALAEEATATAREKRMPMIARTRFQLGGALLLGVVLPLMLRWPAETFDPETSDFVWQANSALGAAVALIFGYAGILQFKLYPGTKATAYVLPSLLVSFGALGLIFFLARMEYSRYMFLMSFLLGTGWLYIVTALRSRHARPRLALVPGGNLRGIDSLKGADWVKLTSPQVTLQGVEAVVVDLHSDLQPAWGRFVARCVLAGLPVYDSKQVAESLTGRVEFGHLSESSFGSVLPSNIYMPLKRAFDFALVLILGLPALLIILAAGILIKLETPGPVFFRQPRMGYRGRTFTCWKLRSMRVGEEAPGKDFTEENDPRITKVGRFIRKYRIDELPQILNIIRGEMSWIGPRPEAIALAEWYAKDIPFYIYRHAVRPGISGWAQVNQGNVAEVDAASIKLQYDFFYIKNFSPWLDLLILLRTIRTILTGFGSR